MKDTDNGIFHLLFYVSQHFLRGKELQVVQPRFVVPNVFTSLSFLLAVWSPLVVAGVTGVERPVFYAASFILFCVLLDKLDGFAARLFNASSEFGAQYDSLADLIAFGVAPAFVAIFGFEKYCPEWYARNKMSVFVAISIYMLCAAMRLAKYNAMDSDGNPNYFSGMPSTLAGAFNALGFILAINYDAFGIPWVRQGLLIMVAATGVLMVSPFYLPKLKPRKNKLLNISQLLVVLLCYVFGFTMQQHEFLLTCVLGYALFGFAFGVIKKGTIDQETQAILDSRIEASQETQSV